MRRRLGLGAVAGAGDASVRDVSMDIQGETHGDFPQEWTMTDPDLVQSSSQENQDSTTTNTVTSPTKTSQPPFSNRGRLGWAIVRVTIPPVLFLTAGIVLLATLGAMQRFTFSRGTEDTFNSHRSLVLHLHCFGGDRPFFKKSTFSPFDQ